MSSINPAAIEATAAMLQAAGPASEFGSILLGTFAESIFMGLLITQVSTYRRLFPRDATWLKVLVALTVFLSILKYGQAVCLVWRILVVHFGDWRYYASVPWIHSIAIPLAALLQLPAQSFFVWRCFTLMNRNWMILVGLSLAILTVVTMSLASTYLYMTDPYNLVQFVRIVVPVLVLCVVSDFTISGLVGWKLLKARPDGVPSTHTLVNKLVAINFGAALPPALSSVICLGTLWIPNRKGNVWEFFVMFTPRLYVFSFMWTLNYRARLNNKSPGTFYGDAGQRSDPETATEIDDGTNTNIRFAPRPSFDPDRTTRKEIDTLQLKDLHTASTAVVQLPPSNYSPSSSRSPGPS